MDKDLARITTSFRDPINALHSSLDRFLGSNEYKPATKYLDLYLIMFWWLENNNSLYRIFYYDCAPSSKRIFHPFLQQQVD